MIRDPKIENHSALYKEFFDFVKGHNPKVGMFLWDKNQGQITDEIYKNIPTNFDKVDAGDFFEEISSVKSSSEIEAIEKAA